MVARLATDDNGLAPAATARHDTWIVGYLGHAADTGITIATGGFVLEGNDLRVNFMLDALLPLGLLTDDNDNLAIAL